MRLDILVFLGAVGAFLTTALGGWGLGLQVLGILMAIDYVTGVAVAVIFKKSKKSTDGGFESRAGLKGLWRKGTMMLVILVAAQIDRLLSMDFFHYGVIVAFVINEVGSFVENVELMGVSVPEKLMQAISLLKKKGGQP